MKLDASQRYVHNGLHYHRFIREYARKVRARSYLEVGVNKGKSLRLIDCASIGVDPHFVIEGDVRGRKPALHLFETTSDDFFGNNDVFSYFPEGVDLAFLDGLHLFEFLLRDFMNAERVASAGGTILLHDCLPVNAEMIERDRGSVKRLDIEYKSHWTGDVWKVVQILQRHRPDLQVALLDCEPTGIVAVRDLQRGSNVLDSLYDNIVEEYARTPNDADGLAKFYSEIDVVSARDYLGA